MRGNKLPKSPRKCLQRSYYVEISWGAEKPSIVQSQEQCDLRFYIVDNKPRGALCRPVVFTWIADLKLYIRCSVCTVYWWSFLASAVKQLLFLGKLNDSLCKGEVVGFSRRCDLHVFFPQWRCGPTRAMASTFLRFLDHTQRRITVGRTSLDEWSARRRDLYLTTRNIQHRLPCPRRDSNPQSQQARDRRPTP